MTRHELRNLVLSCNASLQRYVLGVFDLFFCGPSFSIGFLYYLQEDLFIPGKEISFQDFILPRDSLGAAQHHHNGLGPSCFQQIVMDAVVHRWVPGGWSQRRSSFLPDGSSLTSLSNGRWSFLRGCKGKFFCYRRWIHGS